MLTFSISVLPVLQDCGWNKAVHASFVLFWLLLHCRLIVLNS